MIIDAFLYYNEADVAFLRLSELYDTVDFFVVVEADVTHLGTSRERVFWNDARLERFKDKIKYFPITLEQENGWGKENEHRIKLYDCIKILNPSSKDLIIFSDCDEIPNKDVIKSIDIKNFDVAALNQMFFLYYLNLWAGKNVTGSIAVTWENIESLQAQTKQAFQVLRNHKDYIPRIENGGWHFSYLGSPERLSVKSKSIAEGQNRDCFQTSAAYFESQIETALTEKISPYSQEKLRVIALDEPQMQKLNFLTALQGKWLRQEADYQILPLTLVENTDKFKPLLTK